MNTEAEIVRAVLSEMNRTPYGTTPPRPSHLGAKPKWYVTFLDGAYYERSAHAATVWSDAAGTIWIESVHLGSPTSWAEEEYGERGAVQVMGIDYRNLSLDQVQNRLKMFPKLHDRIETYSWTAGEVSRKSGVFIEMVFDARADMGWFLFRAKIDPKDVSVLESEVRKAVSAMKEVYELTEGAHYRSLLSKS